NINVGVAAIDNRGKVQIAVDDTIYREHRYDTSLEWHDIKELSYAQSRLDGLDQTGHIYSTKDTDPAYNYVAEKLKSYTEIEGISTDFDSYALLSKTGKIEAFSEKYDKSFEFFKEETSTWTDVVKAVNGKSCIVALKQDGTVYVADYNKKCGGSEITYDEVDEWTDIVDIADDTGGSIVGLKSDGTVVCTKEEIKGPDGCFVYNPNTFDVSDWNDIIAISQSTYSLLGLKRDGSVVATGNNENKQLDVSDWHDIVAIAAGDWISVGLKSDGTVVIAGDCGRIALPDVSNMKNLYVPTVKY
ncbi:RCC1 domain-containing protein, partial [[Clostridium] polysaccharolyticum]